MQAKDIPDDHFIKAVQIASLRQAMAWHQRDCWCNVSDVCELLDAPLKVVLAKARRIIKRKLMEGCTCGCRGDFDLRGFPDDPFALANEESDRS